jgi:hypothetical protein
MNEQRLREEYYAIRRRHEDLQRDHAILFDGSQWQTVGETEQRVGCDGWKLVVINTEHGVVASVVTPNGAVRTYR